MTAVQQPPPDEKDWTWVLSRPCPDCRFDASAITLADLPRLVEGVLDTFRARLDSAGAATRPRPDVWSPLEYGCHIRDVCRMFTVRLERMLTEDDPQFANWDQDRTAIEERYWESDPTAVYRELDAAAHTVVAGFTAVPASAYDRPGRRSDGAVFTVDTLGRYFVHDLVHHAWDVRGSAPAR